MTTRHVRFPGPILELVAFAEDAIRQIPPAFPLTATVAVNPYLGQIEMPRDQAAATLAATRGTRLTRKRAELSAMIEDGQIAAEDLAHAAATLGLSTEALRDAAAKPANPLKPLPTVADLAQEITGTDWPDFVAERIGAWAAGHYDEGQAFWPAAKAAPFAAWRAFAARDLTPGIFGLPGTAAHADAMADDAQSAFAAGCEALGLLPEEGLLYFHRLLASLGGWGEVARAKGWVAERDGGRNGDAFALLAVRLTWDAMLLSAVPTVADAWNEARQVYAAPLEPSPDLALDLALQDAADRSAERRLAERLATERPNDAPDVQRPEIQAAFCIDVRSEVFRSALERVDPGIETLGFAGFFGLAVSHRDAASDLQEARGPVLLNPSIATDTTLAAPEEDAARIKARTKRAWGRFKSATVSAFAFVEAAGPTFAVKLLRDTLGLAERPSTPPAPKLDLPLADRIAAATQILRAMSLTSGFAPIVLIAGHGAAVSNAPFASALQCGACGGHAGDVNARLLAGILNDVEVRTGVREDGIEIPDDTIFVAGLHDTVSDTVTLFDVPQTLDTNRLDAALARAGVLARTDRAIRLPGLRDPEALTRRGADWAETRPEWGLAGCHAFIVGPRRASAGLNLEGRVFLHSYDWRADEGFKTLELILTAPVVVASWIALQYHGSSVAPEAFGAGDKLLHNVTAGIGVIEGSAGLLRTGLPWQSVHDGEALVHQPGRLMVVVAAPPEAISDVLGAHPTVKALFENGWLSLITMDDAGHMSQRYEAGTWVPLAEPARPAPAIAAE